MKWMHWTLLMIIIAIAAAHVGAAKNPCQNERLKKLPSPAPGGMVEVTGAKAVGGFESKS